MASSPFINRCKIRIKTAVPSAGHGRGLLFPRRERDPNGPAPLAYI